MLKTMGVLLVDAYTDVDTGDRTVSVHFHCCYKMSETTLCTESKHLFGQWFQSLQHPSHGGGISSDLVEPSDCGMPRQGSL